MSDCLDGARLKLARARTHLVELQSELRAYHASRPFTVSSKVTANAVRAEIDVRVEPPAILSVISGDCVTNARAALDYVAWQLAERYTDKSVDRSDRLDRRVSFPITEQGKFEQSTSVQEFRRRLFPANVVEAIEGVQPYRPDFESMLWLQSLVNADKHRRLLVTPAFPEPANHVVVIPEVDGVNEDLSNTALGVSRLRVIKDGSRMKVDLRGKGHGFVVFDAIQNSIEVDQAISRIVETVGRVVARFEPLLV